MSGACATACWATRAATQRPARSNVRCMFLPLSEAGLLHMTKLRHPDRSRAPRLRSGQAPRGAVEGPILVAASTTPPPRPTDVAGCGGPGQRDPRNREPDGPRALAIRTARLQTWLAHLPIGGGA